MYRDLFELELFWSNRFNVSFQSHDFIFKPCLCYPCILKNEHDMCESKTSWRANSIKSIGLYVTCSHEGVKSWREQHVSVCPPTQMLISLYFKVSFHCKYYNNDNHKYRDLHKNSEFPYDIWHCNKHFTLAY